LRLINLGVHTFVNATIIGAIRFLTLRGLFATGAAMPLPPRRPVIAPPALFFLVLPAPLGRHGAAGVERGRRHGRRRPGRPAAHAADLPRADGWPGARSLVPRSRIPDGRDAAPHHARQRGADGVVLPPDGRTLLRGTTAQCGRGRIRASVTPKCYPTVSTLRLLPAKSLKELVGATGIEPVTPPV
jgi:hypothetical protein